MVERRHPLGVAAGQVVVDGHDVDALAGQRVERDGERARSASCPRRSSSRRSSRRGAPCRRSSGRRSGACPSCAARSRARRRTSRAAGRRAARRCAARSRRLSACARSSSSSSSSSSGSQLLMRFDALGVLLELLAFAQPEGAVEDRHGSEDRAPRGPAGPRARPSAAVGYQAAAASPGPSSAIAGGIGARRPRPRAARAACRGGA